jgi:hypothetical protein
MQLNLHSSTVTITCHNLCKHEQCVYRPHKSTCHREHSGYTIPYIRTYSTNTFMLTSPHPHTHTVPPDNLQTPNVLRVGARLPANKMPKHNSNVTVFKTETPNTPDEAAKKSDQRAYDRVMRQKSRERQRAEALARAPTLSLEELKLKDDAHKEMNRKQRERRNKKKSEATPASVPAMKVGGNTLPLASTKLRDRDARKVQAGAAARTCARNFKHRCQFRSA